MNAHQVENALNAARHDEYSGQKHAAIDLYMSDVSGA